MTESTYVGVDLAWQSERNHTGIVVLRGDCTGARLLDLSGPVHSTRAALKYVQQHTTSLTVVAVDAPLIVRNVGGQRPCETQISKRYGAREASCHTSNLRLYPDPGGVRFAAGLIGLGFVHAVAPEASRSNRLLLEVYPHAAMVALFDLDRIVKYKKGTMEKKRLGISELRTLLRRLTSAELPLKADSRLDGLLTRDIRQMTGVALKQYEDSLDALFAAYLAFFFHCGKFGQLEVFGDLATGYIVNPKLRSNMSR